MTKLMAVVAALVLIGTQAMACSSKASEIQCLQCNIYHEARGESFMGQLAVALVTLNRVSSDMYPNSICRVVWQPSQFSWTSRSKTIMSNNESAEKALEVAEVAKTLHDNDLSNDFFGVDKPVKWFHNPRVTPSWSKRFTHAATIGRHKFYYQ